MAKTIHRVPDGRCETPVKRRSRLEQNGLLRFIFKRRPFEHETSLYLLVSVLDFLMTFWMLNHRGEGPLRFVESNRVASYFLDRWGTQGLFSFKIAAIVFVLLLTIIIGERRPGAARFVLWLGILATGFTVVYSVALYLKHTGLVQISGLLAGAG
jgi:hypothetical protein